MLKLFGNYNARARMVKLPGDRISLELNKSLISIVENDAQVRLEMYYGIADQAVAGKISNAAHNTGKRFIKPNLPQYGAICDLVLQLESPEIYRAATSHAADGGYQIGQDSVKKVVDAAKKGLFAYLFLQNEHSTYVKRSSRHISLDLIFSKKL